MKRIAMFVFNGDAMCFVHVLLNALDMNARGCDMKIIIEGASTRLTPELAAADHPLHALWEKARAAGLIAGVCEACSRKTRTLDAAASLGLPLLNDMNGHPGMAQYQDDGYEIITF